MSKEDIIKIEGLNFTYGCHLILNNINLSIAAGDVVAITGPNGSGKSTLLKLVLGQLKPTSGSIKLFGTEAHKVKERYRIGYLAQKATSFNSQFPATAREVIRSGRVPRRGLFHPLLKPDQLLVDQVLEQVGMLEFADHPVGTLSGGQQQRILLARALVSQPDLLILDEPNTGVDSQALDSMYRLLKELSLQQDMTMLIVSHELEGLASLITHQVCLDKHICSCSCHKYNDPGNQLEHCSRRINRQPANTKEPCYGNLTI
ncbi:metal ABC transporter ATP-binding protein [Desulfotomaculum defluvii]